MKALLAAALLLFATPALAHDPARVAEEVRQADIAFAARAQVVTPAQAFREFMDEEEGQLFGAKPVVGASAIYEAFGGAKPATLDLDWVPTQWWGSRGGDMGVTTGDWRRTFFDGRPTLTGRYVTVWRKNAKGEWKALIDFGEPDETARSNAVGELPASKPSN
ncbi:MAG TPA: hypothetical protein VD906_15005 [Caulobacteraceae bacterium]|nr:hypothetical protein [Caulobacteraceae bacterium]